MLRTALFLAATITVGCGGGIPASGSATDGASQLPEAQALQPTPAPAPLEAAAWGKSSGSLDADVIYTEPGELPRLELATDPSKALSLEHTHVSAKLHGFVAEVEVAQTNPFKEPIEAVYVFPLPENSAVNHLRMVIAERRSLCGSPPARLRLSHGQRSRRRARVDDLRRAGAARRPAPRAEVAW